MIYLDYQATTPIAPEVKAVLTGTFPFAGNDCATLTGRVLAGLGL